MTIHSMTGFGEAEVSASGWTMSVQCRSVNHRGLDVRVWSPREWSWVEPFVLAEARELLHRGRVEVRIECSVAEAESSGARVDPAAFAAVAAELGRNAQAAGIAGPTVHDVLSFEHVRSKGANTPLPDEFAPFEDAIRGGLMALRAARAAEGARLVDTMHSLLGEVASAVEVVDAAAKTVGTEYRSRLETRVQEAVSRFELQELDERAILQEVALYADRSDVSEELQRAKSHIEKLTEVFDADAGGAVGKQIDFYLQELFREANTTGSKSGSVAITEQVIVMKTAIEQMREQAANIE